jgi:hypothetical protein
VVVDCGGGGDAMAGVGQKTFSGACTVFRYMK